MNISAFDNPLYYLANFSRALAWLRERYNDVLDAEEWAFMHAFEALPAPSQALLVRLVMRKGSLFRHGRLAYAEIGCIHAAAQPLCALGWLNTAMPLSLAQLFEVLQKAELVQQFGHHGLAKGLRKAELLTALSAHYSDGRCFADWCPGQQDRVYALTVRPVCDRLRLLFFGNLSQDWSEFVLADLGVFHYEAVALDSSNRALRHREDVDLCLALYRCREQLEQQDADLAGIGQALASLVTDSVWLLARRDKLLFRIAYQHERQQAWAQALYCYQGCAWPGARLRRIRVLERCGEYQAALDLASIAAQACENAAEAQALQRCVPRLRRHLGLAAEPRSKPAGYRRIDLTLSPPLTPTSVEQCVRTHLQQADAPVFYVENTLINSLFGLLCWPAIFAPLPGAFFHPFQSGPADLLQADFRPRRQVLFDQCLGQLDDVHYPQRIRDTYAAKWGMASPFVHWAVLDSALLDMALLCIPAAHLRQCFERLLDDLQANRSGMPDLIQFWPMERRYRMIEVKGPGDRLQDNQLRWLAFCEQQQLPIDVCYVQWQAA